MKNLMEKYLNEGNVQKDLFHLFEVVVADGIQVYIDNEYKELKRDIVEMLEESKDFKDEEKDYLDEVAGDMLKYAGQIANKESAKLSKVMAQKVYKDIL